MACAELVLPGDFDHCHHGGSGLGSGCAHTVSLYRQELGEVQALGDRRCDAVGVHGWKCCRVERRTGRSACAGGFPGIGVGRKITTAGERAEGGFA